MKEIKKSEEAEQIVKSVAQAEQILEQEEALKVAPIEEVVTEAQPAAAPKGGRRRGGDRERKGPPKKTSLTDSGLVEKVVSINRVSKTTKGGTRLAFSALVVVGDAKGKVGY